MRQRGTNGRGMEATLRKGEGEGRPAKGQGRETGGGTDSLAFRRNGEA